MSIPKPLNNRVIIEPIKGPEVTPGGIHIPDVAQKKTNRGRVLAVGPGRQVTPHDMHLTRPPHMMKKESDEYRMPMVLKEGDVVFYSPYGGNEIEMEDGKKLMVFPEDEILAVE